MPLYEYQCTKCKRRTEKIESVAGPHLRKVPALRRESGAAAVCAGDPVQGIGVVCDGLRGEERRERIAAEKADKAEKTESKEAAKETAAKESKETRKARKRRQRRKRIEGRGERARSLSLAARRAKMRRGRESGPLRSGMTVRCWGRAILPAPLRAQVFEREEEPKTQAHTPCLGHPDEE